MSVVGDGVLWRWFSDGPDKEHQRELSKGGVDSLHLQRDPQGEFVCIMDRLKMSLASRCVIFDVLLQLSLTSSSGFDRV